ncbi:MAG: hypothetical protein JXB88_06110 [Spirochaetales bacterium]|nr:hypothetical protein [Spirochaetales bacterium]
MDTKFIDYTVGSGDTLSGVVDRFIKNNLFPNRMFKTESDLDYQKVWDLEENKRPGYICSDANMRKSKKNEKWIYPAEKIALPYIEETILIYVPNNGATIDLSIFTGKNFVLVQTGYKLIIDAHMHIQSLNATPMPLQWGILYKQTKAQMAAASILTKFADTGREELTAIASYRKFTALSAARWAGVFGDFGVLGQFSSDIIGKFLMGKARNEDMKKKLYWLLGKSPDDPTPTQEVGEQLGIAMNSEQRRIITSDFYKNAAYYFKGQDALKINVIMPMDLTFTTIWGHYALPYYLPVPDKKTFLYIEDFKAYKDNGELEHEYDPKNNEKHLFYDFDLNYHLDEFSYLINGTYDIIDYLPPFDPSKPVYFSFDSDKLSSIVIPYINYLLDNKCCPKWPKPGILQNPSDSEFQERRREFMEKLAPLQNEMKETLLSIENAYKNRIGNKKFKHFLREVPGDTTEMFEDYRQQIAYTEASIYRYPLEMVAFYHYDPRRYYQNDSDKKNLLDELDNNHCLVQLTTHNENSHNRKNLFIRKLIDVTTPSFINRDYFKGILFDGVTLRNMQGKTITERKPFCQSFDEIKSKLVTSGGPFLGIKMYPCLGYPPFIYKQDVPDHAIEPFTHAKRYSHLKELYSYCEKEGIPITVHNSPGGMSNVDSFNYCRLNGISPENEYEAIESGLFIEYNCSATKNWEPVLEDFNRLKLCFAHFAGSGRWGTRSVNDPETKKDTLDWRNDIISCINDYPNVYTDISYYAFDEQLPVIVLLIGFSKTEDGEKIASIYKTEDYHYLIRECYHYQSEIGYTALVPLLIKNKQAINRGANILRRIGIDVPVNDIKKTAKHLAEAINQHSALKERILMGSDWYMTEMSMYSLGTYYNAKFELCKMITNELQGEKYDVWHQFAVVNPLNFLGFLKADKDGVLETATKNGMTTYILDMERIDKYSKNLEKLPEDSEWMEFAEVIPDEIKYFTKSIQSKLIILKNMTIYAANEIKESGQLLLTSK